MSQKTAEFTPVPGIEKYLSLNARTAYTTAYRYMHDSLTGGFDFLRPITPAIHEQIAGMALTYARERTQPYVTPRSSLILPDYDAVNVHIVKDLATPEHREQVKALVTGILDTGERIIAERNWDRQPDGERNYGNFANRLFGETDSARHLRVAQETGIMLYGIGYHRNSSVGNLTIGLEFLKEFWQDGGSQTEEGFIKEFMEKLFIKDGNEESWAQFFQISSSHVPFRHRKLPFYANFLGRDEPLENSRGGYYTSPWQSRCRSRLIGIVIAPTPKDITYRQEYDDRLKGWRETQHREETGTPLLVAS